jgi:hypothetical protein
VICAGAGASTITLSLAGASALRRGALPALYVVEGDLVVGCRSLSHGGSSLSAGGKQKQKWERTRVMSTSSAESSSSMCQHGNAKFFGARVPFLSQARKLSDCDAVCATCQCMPQLGVRMKDKCRDSVFRSHTQIQEQRRQDSERDKGQAINVSLLWLVYMGA